MIFVETPQRVLEAEIAVVKAFPLGDTPPFDAYAAGVIAALEWILKGGDAPSQRMAASTGIRVH